MRDDKDKIIRTGGNGRRCSCVAYGGILYVSGITSVELEADVAEQAKDIFGQIEKLLALHGTNCQRLLSVTVYLKSVEDYGAFNSVWDTWVSDGYEPARSVVTAAMDLPEYKVKVAATAALES